MKLKAVIVRPGLWGLTKTHLRDAGRGAILAAGLYWHRHYKKHHFQKYAFAKYGYRRRDPRYERRKQREHPEANGRPLVFTGQSEQLAMGSEVVHATARTWDHYHADVVVSGPTLNFHAAEATATTTGEVSALQNQFANHFIAAYLRQAEVNTGTRRVTSAA